MVQRDMPAFIEQRVAMSAAGLISQRVIYRGIDWQGGRFSSYSKRYADYRRSTGKQVGHKSFEFTTQMWRGFGIKRPATKTQSEIIVTLGGRNAEAQEKINRNSEREGISIIGLSDQEVKQLAKMVDKELQRYINKVGLS